MSSKEKIDLKSEQILRNLWDINKTSNICLIEFTEEESRYL